MQSMSTPLRQHLHSSKDNSRTREHSQQVAEVRTITETIIRTDRTREISQKSTVTSADQTRATPPGSAPTLQKAKSIKTRSNPRKRVLQGQSTTPEDNQPPHPTLTNIYPQIMEYLRSNTHSNTKVLQLLIQTTSTTTHTTPSAAAQTPIPIQ